MLSISSATVLFDCWLVGGGGSKGSLGVCSMRLNRDFCLITSNSILITEAKIRCAIGRLPPG